MHICAMLIDRKYIWLVPFISLRQLHWWMPNILTNTFRISVHKHHHKNHITSMRMVKQRKNVIILCEKIMNLLKNAYFIFYDCVTWWRSHHVHMCCIFNWFCSIMERGIFVIRNEGKTFFCLICFVWSTYMKSTILESNFSKGVVFISIRDRNIF